EANKQISITFDHPTLEMIKHLKPLYIKAQINSKTLSKVFVDGGAILDIMSLTTLKKLGKRQRELITTNMKMTNFTRGATPALGVLVVDIMVGPKTMYSTFFIVDANPTYYVLLERDWIHFSQFVPFILH
ncbi:hypothetical protein glysoja_045108, partial [Glycine soja]